MRLYLFLVATLVAGMMSCKSVPQYNDPVPEHDTFTIESKAVGETRVINVWTPPGYKSGSTSFPVLYMPDGGIKEDFPHIANTLADLIAKGAIPPYILVGIENTQRRRDLTSPTQVEEDKKVAPVVGGSAAFRDFIQDELFPEINRRYRTSGHRAFIGESLAGFFVVETLLSSPDMFDDYIAFDPSLWWNNHDLVSRAQAYLSQMGHSPKRFWFAGSGDVYVYPRQLSQILKINNPEFLTWKYTEALKERHSTIFRATKVAAIQWTLGGGE